MILKRLLRPRSPPERELYAAIVAAARHRVPYAAWGVADTIDGRFDMIALHAFLVLDRLKGADTGFRQRLVDEIFADMDRALREMGVGDLSVAKKIRKMAEVFYGRIAAYEKAVGEDPAALEAALERNVFPDGASPGAVAKLADYFRLARGQLAAAGQDVLLSGAADFPEPLP